jgi:hypothetical protein
MTHHLVDADLAAQPGLTGALVKAAATMEQAFRAAADALREVAWAVDLERRGRMSAPMRQDWAEVAKTIEDLLHGDLLDDQQRKWLADHVRSALPPQEQQPQAPAPAQEPAGFVVYGRETAECQDGAA